MKKEHIDGNDENGPYTTRISVELISTATKEATSLYEDIAQRFKSLIQYSYPIMHSIEADKRKAPILRMLIDSGTKSNFLWSHGLSLVETNKVKGWFWCMHTFYEFTRRLIHSLIAADSIFMRRFVENLQGS